MVYAETFTATSNPSFRTSELLLERANAIEELWKEIQNRSNSGNPRFWEKILNGENGTARKAFLCNNGLVHLATDPYEVRCVNNQYANTRDVEAETLTEGANDYRMAGVEVFMHHIYPVPLASKEMGHIRLMRINFGKAPRSKTMFISSHLNKTANGSHKLSMMEESGGVWIQQPNETTKLPQPGLRNGLSFNHGHNTAQALLRAAMNICHLHGKTDPEDYEFTYERLLAHTGSILLQQFPIWRENAKKPSKNIQFDLKADPLIFTSDRTSPYRIDKLAVWFAWDNQRNPQQFQNFLP